MSPAQISPLNSRFRHPAAFLTPLLILMIKRYLNLKCPKASSGSPHLPYKLSYLTKWQPSSSSWGCPLAHISHSFQQQILLNLLLKSSHPPITTWSKSLPFLIWILPLGFQTHCSHPCPLSVYSQHNSPKDPLKMKARSCCSAPLTQKKIQSPNNGLQGSPSSGSHARPYLSALLLTRFWTAKHTLASKPLPLFPLLQMLQDQLPHLTFYSSVTFSEKSSPKAQHIISKLSLCFLRCKGIILSGTNWKWGKKFTASEPVFLAPWHSFRDNYCSSIGYKAWVAKWLRGQSCF